MFCLKCNTTFARRKLSALQNSMAGWGEFLGDMQRYYSVSLECLNDEFRQEQQEYFMNTSAWADIHPSQLLGPPACFKHYDLLTVTLQDIAAPLQVQPRSQRVLLDKDCVGYQANCPCTELFSTESYHMQ